MPLSKIACWKIHHFMDVSPSCRTSSSGISSSGFSIASCDRVFPTRISMHLCIRVMRFVDHSLGRHKARSVDDGTTVETNPFNMGKCMKKTCKRWEHGEPFAEQIMKKIPKRTDFWWIFGAKNLGEIHSWHRKIPTWEAAPLDTTLLSSNLINECLGDPRDPTGSQGCSERPIHKGRVVWTGFFLFKHYPLVN